MSEFLEAILKRGIGALDKKMGIEIIEASPARLVGTMPVEGNTQPIGLLHGGANVVLAESLGSIGTQLHAGADRKIVGCLLYTSPSPRDRQKSRMPSSA